MAQADLPGIAGEQIEPECDQSEDFGERQQIQAVAIEAERRGAGEHKAQADQRCGHIPRGPWLWHVSDVSRGAHALRTRTRPNTPSGFMISTAMMMIKVMASAKDGET